MPFRYDTIVLYGEINGSPLLKSGNSTQPAWKGCSPGTFDPIDAELNVAAWTRARASAGCRDFAIGRSPYRVPLIGSTMGV